MKLRRLYTLAGLSALTFATTASAWIVRETNNSEACILADETVRVFESGSIDVILHVTPCPPAEAGVNDMDGDGKVDTQTCDTLTETDAEEVMNAMSDIHNVMNNIAGVDFDIQIAQTSEPFTFGVAVGETTPTLHVGFIVDPDVADGGAAVTTPTPKSEGCRYQEQHMMVRDQTLVSKKWAWDEPSADLVPWYLAGQFYGGERSFRMIYIHELMHALGFKHVNDTYSMLNNQDRPFFNTEPGGMIRPLANDIAALRRFYPKAGANVAEAEVRLTNSWFVGDQAANATAAAPQLGNCVPSAGGETFADRWGAKPTGGSATVYDPDGIPTCGITSDGLADSAVMCPGDTVRAEVTVMNTGTLDLDLDMELWFSTDDVLSADDVRSDTTRATKALAGNSNNRKKKYEVPALSTGEYFVISKVIGTPGNGAPSTDDWIPLRGTITITDTCSAPTLR
jgi:hypothetical protein